MTIISEFALIKQFFTTCGIPRNDCLLGIGDDAALLKVPTGWDLVVTQDTLVEGIHFFPETDPTSLGHKSLAVNLSDLAAMGANPAWFTLALTLPIASTEWLAAFTTGLCALARESNVLLVGGDTTKGPLSLSLTAMGFTPSGQALQRSGAKPGDLIYVSGTIGAAGLALLQLTNGNAIDTELRNRLERPTPRLALGQMLRGLASAAIDISDGLTADLGHILTSSNVGANLQFNTLPLSATVRDYINKSGDFSLPLIAGDDYELCFTVPTTQRAKLESLATEFAEPITCIGDISFQPGLRIYDTNGAILPLSSKGYEHF